MQSAVLLSSCDTKYRLRILRIELLKASPPSIRPTNCGRRVPRPHENSRISSTCQAAYPSPRKCTPAKHAVSPGRCCTDSCANGPGGETGTAKIVDLGDPPPTTTPPRRSLSSPSERARKDKDQRRGRGRGRGQERDQADKKPGVIHPGQRTAHDAVSGNLKGIQDMASLADRIQQHAAAWSAEGDVRKLLRVFGLLVQLGDRRGPDRALCQSAFRTLAASYLRLVPKLQDAHHCAYPLWACAKLRLWNIRLAAALLARLTEPLAGADDTAGDLSSGQRRGRCETLLHAATNQSHANLWWAASRAPRDVVGWAEEALRASKGCLLRLPAERLRPQLCSNVLLACCRLKRRDKELMLHMAECLADKGGSKAEGRVGSEGDGGKEAAEGEGSKDDGFKQAVEGRTEEAAEVDAVGMREDGVKATGEDAGKDGVRGRGTDRTQSNAQDLANALYSLSLLGGGEGPLLSVVEALCATVLRRLRQHPEGFTPQALSNIIWALEKLRPRSMKSLNRALARECKRRNFADFLEQDFSNTAWALAKTGWSDPDWYAAFVQAASRPGVMAAATQQAWANVWHALALARHRPHDTLIERTTSVRPHRCRPGAGGGSPPDTNRPGKGASPLETLRLTADPQACSNLLWALAVLAIDDRRLVDVLASRLRELLQREGSTVSAQQLTCSAWALAAMEPHVLSRHGELAERLLLEAARRWGEEAVVAAPAAVAAAAAGGGTGSAAGGGAAVVDDSTAGAADGDSGGLADVDGGGRLLGKQNLMQLWHAHQELWHVGRGQELAGHLASEGPLAAAIRRVGWRSDRNTSRTQRLVLVSLQGLQRRLNRCGPKERGELRAAEGSAANRSQDGTDGSDGRSRGECHGTSGGRSSSSGGCEDSSSDGSPDHHRRGSGCNGSSGSGCGADGSSPSAGDGDSITSSGSSGSDGSGVAGIPPCSDSSSSSSSGGGSGSGAPVARRATLGGAGPIRALQEEHFVEAMFTCVDVVVELECGRRVAVEVDGPQHYMSNEPYTRVKTGATRLRDRQLQRVFGNDNVLTVPYWEWDELREEDERHTYLCRLLGLPFPEP